MRGKFRIYKNFIMLAYLLQDTNTTQFLAEWSKCWYVCTVLHSFVSCSKPFKIVQNKQSAITLAHNLSFSVLECYIIVVRNLQEIVLGVTGVLQNLVFYTHKDAYFLFNVINICIFMSVCLILLCLCVFVTLQNIFDCFLELTS